MNRLGGSEGGNKEYRIKGGWQKKVEDKKTLVKRGGGSRTEQRKQELYERTKKES